LDDIDTMPAGRELDILIAEKVFSAEVYNTARNPKESFFPRSRQMLDGPSCVFCEQNGLGGDAYEIPDYSTDIAAAWLVWEKIINMPGVGDWLIRADSKTCEIVEFDSEIYEGGWLNDIASGNTAPPCHLPRCAQDCEVGTCDDFGP